MKRRLIVRLNTLLVIGLLMFGIYWAYYARIRYHLYLELKPIELSNCEMKRFGRAHDGGYPLCQNFLSDITAVYSYGIEGRDSFGCAVSDALEVPVHQYDCFDLREPTCEKDKAVFHPECIGDKDRIDDGRVFKPFAQHLLANKHSDKKVVLKLDVEGAEIPSLLKESDQTLQQIQQLVVEIHDVNSNSVIQLVKRLKKYFYIVDVHFNNYSCGYYGKYWPLPARVFEVLFVSKEIAGAAAGSKPPEFPNQLWSPNEPALPDCQFDFYS